MTDTEAKALALVNADYTRWTMENVTILVAGFKAMHSRLEATEARHAAELREIKERFSEVAARAKRFIEWTGLSRLAYDCLDGSTPSFVVDDLAPFILPAPDPLVDVFDECFEQGMKEGETWSESMARKARTALAARGGKIVWEAGE